ncbi:MAG: valine--tRNA ligase, partial [Eggerthellaceae bacterium]|nr:valine--tRNA ligase [Eggerthellaceae bacterium]
CEKATEHLMMASWPQAEQLAKWADASAERAIQMVCDTVGAIRSTRSRYGISPKTPLDVAVKASSEDVDLLVGQSALVKSLGNAASFTVSADASKPAESSVVLDGGLEIYVCLSGYVDFAAERTRLEKEHAKLAADAAKFQKKLSNPGFLAKAAPEIVQKDKAKLAELTDKLAKLEAQLSELS